MIHMGQSVSPMREILRCSSAATLSPHVCACANGILDEQGRLFPDVTRARRRGVIFDLGNGARSFELD